jgi:hypothetical protein
MPINEVVLHYLENGRPPKRGIPPKAKNDDTSKENYGKTTLGV